MEHLLRFIIGQPPEGVEIPMISEVVLCSDGVDVKFYSPEDDGYIEPATFVALAPYIVTTEVVVAATN